MLTKTLSKTKKTLRFLTKPYNSALFTPEQEATWLEFVESFITQLVAPTAPHSINKLSKATSSEQRTPTKPIYATRREWARIGLDVDSTHHWGAKSKLGVDKAAGFIPMLNDYYEYGQTVPTDSKVFEDAIARLLKLASEHNIKVIMRGACVSGHNIKVEQYVEQCIHANGLAFSDKVVIVHHDLHPRYEIKVLTHEIAHQILNHPRTWTDRSENEIQAETMAYVLLRALGMPCIASSQAYLEPHIGRCEKTLRNALSSRTKSKIAYAAFQLRNISAKGDKT